MRAGDRARPLAEPHVTMAAFHAHRPRFARRLQRAQETIAWVLTRSTHPYVAFSGGKDSSVLLHLVWSQRPETTARFLSSGESRLLHDFDGVLDWFRARGASIEEVLLDRVFAPAWEGRGWDEVKAAGGRHGADFDCLTHGHDALFLGLREDESRGRRMSLRTHREPGAPYGVYRYRVSGHDARAGLLRACPLACWSVEDVTAYVAIHAIPVLAWYHQWGMQARTAARLGRESVRLGILKDMGRSNPTGYHALLRRFPELREAL